MIRPSQYKDRYEAINVPLANGSSTTVTVNKYRLVGSNYQAQTASAFLSALRRHGIDTQLRIDTGDSIVYVDPRLTQHEDALKKKQSDFYLSGTSNAPPANGRRAGILERVTFGETVNTRITDWDKLARMVFAGKGSPEACQIVLQLANYWGLASDLQQYADSALGLDCNGFVGNYLWHVRNGNPWYKLGAGNHDLGPDSPIRTGFYDRYQHQLIDRWESLDSGRTYIMMETDNSGNVVNGGTGNANTAGHIVITEPGLRNYLPGQNGDAAFAVWVVESTGSHAPGLTESWYTCEAVDTAKKMFSLFRGDMIPARQRIKFKIAAVA